MGLNNKATGFNDFLNEQLKNPNLKKEYDALEAEFSDIQKSIDAKKAAGLADKGYDKSKGKIE